MGVDDLVGSSELHSTSEPRSVKVVAAAGEPRSVGRGPEFGAAFGRYSSMKPISEIDAIRQHAILSSLAGFPFLLVFAVTWTAGAALSYVVPREVAPWVYPVLGMPAMAVAVALERRLGYLPASRPDPLLPLALQIAFVQVVAFPALLIVWDQKPEYLPAAFAAVVGAHFLPFQWIYRTRLYGILGVVVATGPFVLVVRFQEESLHYTGFFVGGVLFVGAFVARSHAKAVWASRTHAAQQANAPDGAAHRR